MELARHFFINYGTVLFTLPTYGRRAEVLFFAVNGDQAANNDSYMHVSDRFHSYTYMIMTCQPVRQNLTYVSEDLTTVCIPNLALAMQLPGNHTL